MKKIITLFVLVASCSAAIAQKTATSPDIAKSTDAMIAVMATPPVEALFVKETEYNFGKIPQGKPVTHIFEVGNTGKDSLHIINVAASCGCTTPEWEKDKKIPSGATSKITVGYNAAAEGPFAKTITVTYNENQVKVITIKGEVWKTPNASAPENSAVNDLKN
jgi:Protein of unknown function (DUF1573)